MRPRPRDDRELEDMTGIKPADHGYTTSDHIRMLERKMLGPGWFRPRPKKEEK